MDDEFGVNKAWELFNLLKRVRPIDKNSVNDKSTIETIKTHLGISQRSLRRSRPN